MASITVPDFKLDWKLARRILYTALVVWIVAVRFLGIDPLGLAKALPIAWLFDALTLAAITLLVWHFWEMRPKI